ncbi:MAG: TIGR01777 family oxidoreductase [Saprospiraceae bacterium]
MQKIIIPGGSGFLGQHLANYFSNKGFEIIILSRSTKPSKGNIYYAKWDGKTMGDWTSHFENAFAIINMTGRSVDCRYTATNKTEILNSRVDSTKIIGEAIEKTKNPPKIWLNSSTGTIYRYSEDKEMTEKEGEIGEGFSVDVAKAWEKTFQEVKNPNVRKVIMRTSIVIGKNGGAMQPLVQLTKFGLGGSQGTGKQFISWLQVQDFCRITEYLIDNQNAEGIYNVVSPKPIRNKTFMKILRNVLHVPIGLPAMKWMIEIGAFFMRTESELVLKSRRLVPERLLSEGFEFKYVDIEEALKASI